MSENHNKISASAEACIKSLSRNRQGRMNLTTSQIRKFLAGVNSVRNQVQVQKARGEITDTLTPEVLMAIDYLKIRLTYQCRERAVKDFTEQSKMLTTLDKIGDSPKRFEQFCMYVEALVAYHKFYGGN